MYWPLRKLSDQTVSMVRASNSKQENKTIRMRAGRKTVARERFMTQLLEVDTGSGTAYATLYSCCYWLLNDATIAACRQDMVSRKTKLFCLIPNSSRISFSIRPPQFEITDYPFTTDVVPVIWEHPNRGCFPDRAGIHDLLHPETSAAQATAASADLAHAACGTSRIQPAHHGWGRRRQRCRDAALSSRRRSACHVSGRVDAAIQHLCTSGQTDSQGPGPGYRQYWLPLCARSQQSVFLGAARAAGGRLLHRRVGGHRPHQPGSQRQLQLLLRHRCPTTIAGHTQGRGTTARDSAGFPPVEPRPVIR